MKKIILVLLFALILSVSAFAHPGGWGIGIVGQYNLAWDGFEGARGVALSLKTPGIPIFWGINADFRQDGFGVSLTGDRYLYFVRGRTTGLYMGIGAYAGVVSVSRDPIEWTSARVGGRIPIGLYIFPISFFEFFVSVVPSLGVGIYFGDHPDRFHFPEGGLGMDIGIRFWLR